MPPGRAGSRAASRLGSSALVDDADTTGGEDGLLLIEDESDQQNEQGILLKSDTHTVTILGGRPQAHIPAEAIDVLAKSDFYADPHTAVLDNSSGYACLVGKSKCYVWSIAEVLQSGASHNVSRDG